MLRVGLVGGGCWRWEVMTMLLMTMFPWCFMLVVATAAAAAAAAAAVAAVAAVGVVVAVVAKQSAKCRTSEHETAAVSTAAVTMAQGRGG
jgi:hypothetical protein